MLVLAAGLEPATSVCVKQVLYPLSYASLNQPATMTLQGFNCRGLRHTRNLLQFNSLINYPDI